MRKKILSALLGFSLILSGCTQSIPTESPSPAEPIPDTDQPTATEINEDAAIGDQENNIFVLTDIEAGSQVGEMEVVSIDPFNETHDMGVPPSKLSDANASIEFSGEITLTGDFYYATEGVVNDEYCFQNLDNASLKKLPTLNTDRRHLWFCFSNKSDAKQLLGEAGGKATIAIDQYVINRYPSEVWNSARLKEVVLPPVQADDSGSEETFSYNIFGENAFDSTVKGYLKVKEMIVYNDKQENAYFIITEFEDEGLKESIRGGIERGNSVNHKEGDHYAFNLGCFTDGLVQGRNRIEGEPYIDDKTQEALLNSSSDNPVSLILTFGYHGGSGCLCCNLAHKIRVAE